MAPKSAPAEVSHCALVSACPRARHKHSSTRLCRRRCRALHDLDALGPALLTRTHTNLAEEARLDRRQGPRLQGARWQGPCQEGRQEGPRWW